MLCTLYELPNGNAILSGPLNEKVRIHRYPFDMGYDLMRLGFKDYN